MAATRVYCSALLLAACALLPGAGSLGVGPGCQVPQAAPADVTALPQCPPSTANLTVAQQGKGRRGRGQGWGSTT